MDDLSSVGLRRLARVAAASVLFLIVATPALAGRITLAWDANKEADLRGYRILFGTTSRTYQSTVDVGKVTSFTVANLQTAGTYYLVVRAYNAQGLESANSSEIVGVARPDPDIAAPTVSIFLPAAGSTVSGTAAVSASASDNVGVAGVQFRLDGAALGAEDVTAPYGVSWDTRTASNGVHMLTAVARDAAGNVTASSAVDVTVSNDATAPLLSAIGAGAITISSATITWSTNEASNSRVEYGPTTAYGSSTPVDGSLVTAHSLTLTALSDATLYHYRVRSSDAAGNMATSADLTFTTPDGTPPTVSISGPAGGTTVSGAVTMTAIASDNAGVAGVQFTVDGAPFGAEVPRAPYAIAWDTTLVSDGAHIVTAIARDVNGRVGWSAAVPVLVDNGVLWLAPEDTLLTLDTTNYSTYPVLGTYTWPDRQPAIAALMKVNLSTVPAGAVVQDATLVLTMLAADNQPDSGYAMSVHKVVGANPQVAAATGYTADGVTAWTPSTCCVNNVPLAQANLSAAFDTRAVDKVPGYKLWSMTAMVRDWLAAPATNRGFVLNGDPLAMRDRFRYFASTEFPYPHVRPTLRVAYSRGSLTDSTPPALSMTAPAAGAVVADAITLSATASDSSSVTGVRFTLDGAPLGPELTAAPYTLAWDTSLAADGRHTLIAIARDAAANIATSIVEVVVENRVVRVIPTGRSTAD